MRNPENPATVEASAAAFDAAAGLEDEGPPTEAAARPSSPSAPVAALTAKTAPPDKRQDVSDDVLRMQMVILSRRIRISGKF